MNFNLFLNHAICEWTKDFGVYLHLPLSITTNDLILLTFHTNTVSICQFKSHNFRQLFDSKRIPNAIYKLPVWCGVSREFLKYNNISTKIEQKCITSNFCRLWILVIKNQAIAKIIFFQTFVNKKNRNGMEWSGRIKWENA